ncbi:MAG: hypothetical protein LBR38_09395 [Synergistaceae bacterium]|nr:hypothetical protein [Synergistaceae bacterium]
METDVMTDFQFREILGMVRMILDASGDLESAKARIDDLITGDFLADAARRREDKKS